MTSPHLPHSWIVEVRERLATPPPRRLAAVDLRAAAALVPLAVAEGELWTLLAYPGEERARPRQASFVGVALEPGESPWDAARRAATAIGFEPRTVVLLGELDEIALPQGQRVVPCVAAVPGPLRVTAERDAFVIPLRALADPRLIEERRLVLDGVPQRLRVYHHGRHRIWGSTALIVEALLLRLGLALPETASL